MMGTRAIETTTLSAPTIVCGGYANAIKKTLSGLDGVCEVNVDVARKTGHHRA